MRKKHLLFGLSLIAAAGIGYAAGAQTTER
jgi:hypothetical protein